MEVKRIRRNAFIIVAVFVLAIMMTASIVVFHHKINDFLTDLSICNITEVQELVTQTLRAKINDQLNMLEAQTRYFEDVDINDFSQLKKTIMETKGIGDFKKIAVANKEGMCVSYKGQLLPNIKNKTFFYNTIRSGQAQIASRIEMDDNLQPVLSLTYPIKRGDEVEAMLIGTLSYKVLIDLFSISMFSGQGYMYIITDTGNIILCNKNKDKPIYNINLYDYFKSNVRVQTILLEKMRADVLSGRAGVMFYPGDNGKKLASYAPLGINKWSIISVVPYSYITQQHFKINLIVFVLLGEMLFTIGVFLLLIFVLFRKGSLMEKDNERLTIATTQSQVMIFEYDIQKQVITFSGESRFIIGNDRKTFTIDYFRREYYKRIHPEDSAVMEQVKRHVEGDCDEFSAEIRYKDFSDEYIWIHLSGRVIKDDESKKFIGSVRNVNDQVIYEQKLKSLAENDNLTGLLNKVEMEARAKQFFEECDDSMRSALFIIDLDNFKNVNDTLGHMTGDMAIEDAAKKISLIFTERDYISRFGGDEFCILLRFKEDTEKSIVKKIIRDKAKNLCKFLSEDYFDEKNTVSVSASVGISLYPEHGRDYESLFKHADAALYEVKQGGKNGYKIYDKKM